MSLDNHFMNCLGSKEGSNQKSSKDKTDDDDNLMANGIRNQGSKPFEGEGRSIQEDYMIR